MKLRYIAEFAVSRDLKCLVNMRFTHIQKEPMTNNYRTPYEWVLFQLSEVWQFSKGLTPNGVQKGI